MIEQLQSVKGMNDILPSESGRWQRVEYLLTQVLMQAGYQEIRMPIIESTALFKRTIGEITDIVTKEMYVFADLNGDSIALRPEGTAGCVRACIEHALLRQTQKLWYLGVMHRHEKPQKGRYRQFHQMGVELFGIATVAAELELLALAQRWWRQLGVSDVVQLELNTLGDITERQIYHKQLHAFLTANKQSLDAESLLRLDKNPLRILDSKDLKTQELLQQAPQLWDALGQESRSRFESLMKNLDKLGITYTVNSRLVRGLDYYAHTVFEYTTQHLGSQATVCAGGRYDGLVQQLGGQKTPAIGMALGIERIILLAELVAPDRIKNIVPFTVYIIPGTLQYITDALLLAEQIMQAHINWKIITDLSGASFKSQFKKADKSGADIAVILGEAEIVAGMVGIKHLRHYSEQINIKQQDLLAYLMRSSNL